MTIVINLIGAPGSGKSTLAAILFGEMKRKGYSVELVTEFAKDLVWEESTATFDDELYIFANQNHRLFRLKNKVDFVICDAPIIQKLHYMPKDFDFSDLVLEVFSQYDNLNFFLQRKDWDYETFGRHHTAAESDKIKNSMLFKLTNNNIDFELLSNHTTTEQDLQHILDSIDNAKQASLEIKKHSFG